MNKTEKIICILLGCVLAWYIFTQQKAKPTGRTEPTEQRTEQREDRINKIESGLTGLENPVQSNSNPAHSVSEARPVARPDTPEEIVVLENDELRLELSTWGGVVKKATLKKYAQKEGAVGEDNPPVVFDFGESPLGEVGNLKEAGVAEPLVFRVERATPTEVVFATELGPRKVTLSEGYRVTYEDDWFNLPTVDFTLSLGSMAMGEAKNDLLSVDSWQPDAKGGKVIHHDEGDSPLKGYLVGGVAGGCGGAKSAAGMPKAVRVACPGAQTWIALKNRFFVTALVSTTAENKGFGATVVRDTASAAYRPARVSARAVINPGEATKVTSVFYVGPKKQSLLWGLGMKDVMEFGMWRWICYPLVWVLNVFHAAIPNYGVAIILLTILVRLLFWPLTHKSTVGMKRMQELQPKMKEIQAKFKDNPQRLQQETFALYREHKVNPMSSCLPMLIQIPVFIALFNVLRSAVELRYAPFLWIGDLSQPEGLFASWFPFGGLNILPILMALTMGLQSALTPTAGDPRQQRMMMVMMPVMMLFMFYSFPSALSLYWTLSQVVSIVQMWVIRRQTAAKQGNALTPEVLDPPQTRQMRRHS